MTVLLALTTEQEERLRQAAHRRGLDTDRLLREVMDAALAQLEKSEPFRSVEDPPSLRIPDLHAGQTWVSDDFDAPLPDSFWLGEE